MSYTFGIFIRSMGERTETLCLDSVRKTYGLKNVHVIKGVSPAYKAFEIMFRKALENRYDWYLGLDADVVLLPNWLRDIKQIIENRGGLSLFSFSLPMIDPFIGSVDKGNHIFNGNYTDRALKVLRTKTRFSLKPESSIKSHVASTESIYFQENQPIGLHGCEQFYKDIAYRFFLQRLRRNNRQVAAKLRKEARRNPVSDFRVALCGWNKGRNAALFQPLRKMVGINPYESDMRQRDMFSELFTHLGIEEKGELKIALDQFYRRYNRLI